MKNQKNVKNDPASGATAKDPTVEVLYQKMGDRWFAFSAVDEEVFIGSISQEEIDHLEGAHPDARTERPLKHQAES